MDVDDNFGTGRWYFFDSFYSGRIYWYIKLYRDSKWGIADNWGPYRAALSYSSKSGMASSFMFFGTAKTLRSGI